jgi:hypothetical protein
VFCRDDYERVTSKAPNYSFAGEEFGRLLSDEINHPPPPLSLPVAKIFNRSFDSGDEEGKVCHPFFFLKPLRYSSSKRKRKNAIQAPKIHKIGSHFPMFLTSQKIGQQIP